MYKNLAPGTIGIRGLTLAETIDLAKKTGFGGVGFSIQEAAQLVDQHGLAYVQDLFARAGIRPGHWGLPVPWNQDKVKWQAGLDELPKYAALARDLGCPRTATWCPPASDERDFQANLDWHVARFRPIAQILADHGCRLGIEFIGPQTLRAGKKYTFIYTMQGMLDMAATIGTGNVGLLLDAYHLYTSGGSIDDLDQIANADIVVVHVNDAPAGVPREEQMDLVRRMPMETGVIDLPGFMKKLQALGYDGPVTPEPFSERVNAIEDPLEAAQFTAGYMDQMWQAAGLS